MMTSKLSGEVFLCCFWLETVIDHRLRSVWSKVKVNLMIIIFSEIRGTLFCHVARTQTKAYLKFLSDFQVQKYEVRKVQKGSRVQKPLFYLGQVQIQRSEKDTLKL